MSKSPEDTYLNNVQVAIPTYNRQGKLRSHKLFPSDIFDVSIVFHNEQQRDSYLEAQPELAEYRLCCTGLNKGIPGQRQWMQDNIVPYGEWFVMADDNIDEITALPEPWYEMEKIDVQDKDSRKKWPPLFKTKCEPWRLSEIFQDMMELGDQQCAYYQGFATTGNAFFRGVKYRSVGFVIAKMAVMKNTGFVYDPNVLQMEDFSATAQHLLLYGRVLINNYVFPVAGHYQAGGNGTLVERSPLRIKDCAYLESAYKGLFRFKDREGFPPNSDLSIRFTSNKQVDEWRKSFF